jgi:hypothetical protein
MSSDNNPFAIFVSWASLDLAETQGSQLDNPQNKDGSKIMG